MSYLLQEDGDKILQETGYGIFLNNLIKVYLAAVTLTLSAANSILKSLTRTYSATLTLTAGIVKKISRLLEATINLSANYIVKFVKELAATITLTSAFAYQLIYGLILKATITLSISIGKIINAIRMIPKIIGAFFNKKPLNSNIDSNNKPKTYR